MRDGAGSEGLAGAIAREAAGFPGDFAMFATNLATGESVGFQPDAVMPTASVIKVCVLCELYRQVGEGTADLGERREVTPDDWWGGSGVLKEFAPGLQPTVRDLARMMIVVSDNVATGMLVRMLGKDRINATMREWGLRETELLWKAAPGGSIRDYALGTPRELARLMALIATDAVLTPEACAAIRDHLSRQQYLDQIPRYLPFNPYASYFGDTPPVSVMNKTGFYTGVRVDAAIVTAGDVTFTIATMIENHPDPLFQPEHAGMVLNGRVAKMVYDAWCDVG